MRPCPHVCGPLASLGGAKFQSQKLQNCLIRMQNAWFGKCVCVCVSLYDYLPQSDWIPPTAPYLPCQLCEGVWQNRCLKIEVPEWHPNQTSSASSRTTGENQHRLQKHKESENDLRGQKAWEQTRKPRIPVSPSILEVNESFLPCRRTSKRSDT